MKVVNETCCAVHALPGIGPGDQPVLTVVVKGTFEVVPGGPATPAAEAAPVAFGDELAGSVPRWDSDLAPFKPRADVLLVGRGYAPQDRPARELDVRLRVGPVTKALRLFGERRWERGRFGGDPRPGPPSYFTEMEISWAHAYGGAACPENPVGIGFLADGAKKGEVEGRELPRIEDPARPFQRWNERPSPAGLGALGRGWAARARHLGTYDERWERERRPLPPRDFSFEFHQAAPRDQQVEGWLAGDESFELANLTPAGRLGGSLPGARPRARVQRTGRSRLEPVELRLDTLVLIPERGTLLLTWRGLAPIPALERIDVAAVHVDGLRAESRDG